MEKSKAFLLLLWFCFFYFDFTDWLFLSTFTWRWESNCFSFRQSTDYDLGFSRLTGLRFVFNGFCYGSNLPGGIFLPILTLGAIIGTLYGSLCPIRRMDPIFVKNF